MWLFAVLSFLDETHSVKICIREKIYTGCSKSFELRFVASVSKNSTNSNPPYCQNNVRIFTLIV